MIENPEIVRMVVAYIRAGAFDRVACEATGIAQQTFLRWMQQGDDDETARLDTSDSRFFREVRHARAEARLAAEVEVKRTEPLSWLMKGPGRERPGEPGWSNGGDGDAAAVINAVKIEVVYINRRDDRPGDPPEVLAAEYRELPE
jgi:hypothetical protein